MIKTGKVKTGVASFLLGVSLMGVAGCETFCPPIDTTQPYFLESREDWKLYKLNNDLYLEKLDGSENKRLTFSPGEMEWPVRFIRDGKYVVYCEMKNGSEKYYIQPVEKNAEDRKEIRGDEFVSYIHD